MLNRYITLWQGDKLSMVFSNVPGPKTPYTFIGKKTKKIFFFVPGMGEVASGISIISHGNVVKIGCISDTSNIEKPAEMIHMFEQNYDKLMKKE